MTYGFEPRRPHQLPSVDLKSLGLRLYGFDPRRSHHQARLRQHPRQPAAPFIIASECACMRAPEGPRLGLRIVVSLSCGSMAMVYDWDGTRTRRLKLFRTGTALMIAIAVLGIPLLFYAVKLHDLYG